MELGALTAIIADILVARYPENSDKDKRSTIKDKSNDGKMVFLNPDSFVPAGVEPTLDILDPEDFVDSRAIPLYSIVDTYQVTK